MSECDHQHCHESERCKSLEEALRGVAEMQDKDNMTEEERVRLRFEYTESVSNIQAWRAHLLRSSNQDRPTVFKILGHLEISQLSQNVGFHHQEP